MEVKLHYYCVNGGDGSAGVQFCETKKDAEKADEEQNEKGDGWGESSVNSVTLKVEDGKIFFQSFERVGNKYERVWKEIK